MAKRLSLVMHEEMGINQFSFCKGKQILDCVLIANEIVSDLKKKKKEDEVLFKVDFYKAYDSVYAESF